VVGGLGAAVVTGGALVVGGLVGAGAGAGSVVVVSGSVVVVSGSVVVVCSTVVDVVVTSSLVEGSLLPQAAGRNTPISTTRAMQVLRAERGQTAKSRRPEAASLVSFGVSRISPRPVGPPKTEAGLPSSIGVSRGCLSPNPPIVSGRSS